MLLIILPLLFSMQLACAYFFCLLLQPLQEVLTHKHRPQTMSGGGRHASVCFELIDKFDNHLLTLGRFPFMLVTQSDHRFVCSGFAASEKGKEEEIMWAQNIFH